MKKIIIVLIVNFLTLTVSFSQNNTENSGTWQAVGLKIPTWFNYDKESNNLTTYSYFNRVQKLFSVGETKINIEDLKKSIPESLDKFYLELKTDSTFELWANNELAITGTYISFSPIPVISFNSSEEDLLKFSENYGYNGGLKLIPKRGKDFFVNFKNVGNEKLIILNFGEIIINMSQMAKNVYTLKKISSEKAILLKQQQKSFEDKKLQLEKKVEVEKKVEDELKNGKVYTIAEKIPSIINENEITRKIILNLYSNAMNNGASSGKYSITVYFIVEKDGSITNVEVPKDIGFGLKKETIEQVQKYIKATTAENNGEKVRYQMKKELTFTIADE